jgi:hypothetical protein
MNCNFVGVNISSLAYNLFGIQLNVYVIDNQVCFGYITASFGFAVVRFNDFAYSIAELEFSKRLFLF